ncbi:hypothetical protein BDW02DRAFT_264401 [Decorospora gaudefroyi]|uniref:Rhodopsin domain-containing protein n=1 Tax=Decorospora gaudefroyi TaxID=184978 RepID=A0A6A5KFQ1_9PLEO|nr:hypothetical protein BDW02DRAFT_264401 [Decorospora gaudefroyi]
MTSSHSNSDGALPPPLGITPNFKDPESIASRLIIASVVGPVITIPLCIVRFYTKRYILRNTGWDDYTIIASTLLALGYSILISIQTTNGLGNHMWDVPTHKFNAFMKIGGTGGPIFYHLSALLFKVSLCAFYLRFALSRSLRTAVHAVAVITVIYSLLAAFPFVWVCQPMSKYWNLSSPTGSCIDLDAFFLSIACINAATDLALLVLPLFIIKDLRLPARKKAGVAALLMTGSIVCVVSLIRLETVVHGMLTAATDVTWVLATNFTWLVVEMWLGIICTCLPTLYTFIRKRFGNQADKPTTGDQNIHWIEQDMILDSSVFATKPSSDSGAVKSNIQLREAAVIRPVASNSSLLTTHVRSGD